MVMLAAGPGKKLVPILLLGGVVVLGFAAWKFGQKGDDGGDDGGGGGDGTGVTMGVRSLDVPNGGVEYSLYRD